MCEPWPLDAFSLIHLCHQLLRLQGWRKGELYVSCLPEQVARLIHLDTGEQPIITADYGSSEGKNSLVPMRAAIAVPRARAGSERPIFVYHTDL